jgi:hypothetical protein
VELQWKARLMEHRGIQYQVEEMTEATGFIRTAHLHENTKIGVSLSKESAIFNAERAIDSAVGSQPKSISV